MLGHHLLQFDVARRDKPSQQRVVVAGVQILQTRLRVEAFVDVALAIDDDRAV